MPILKITNKKIDRNAPCWCGSGRKYKQCHEKFDERLRRAELSGHVVPPHRLLKTQKDVAGIRESAKVNIAVLDEVASKICVGMSTAEIDRIVHETTVKAGAVPAPLGFEGFPKSVCTSINEEVCHGIPDDDHVLQDGDIINVDCSTIYHGYYSDSSRMFLIGDVIRQEKRLTNDNRRNHAQSI